MRITIINGVKSILLLWIIFNLIPLSIYSQDYNSLYKQAYDNINTDPKEALRLANLANILAKESKELKKLADSYYLLGYLQEREKKYNEALTNLFNGLKYYRLLEHENSISDIMINIGLIFEINFSYNNAIKYHLNAVKIKERSGSQSSLADSYRSLARLYRYAGHYDSALLINERALELFFDLKDQNKSAIIYNEIGINLEELEKYDEAIDYYFKAILIVEGTKYEKSRRAKTYNNAGIAYLRLENFMKAKSYFTKAINLKESITGFDIESKMSTLNNLAAIYKRENIIDSAKYFYEWSMALATTKDHHNKELKVCLDELKNIAEIEGDLQKENEYLKLLAETYNSLLDDKMNYQRLYSFQEIQTTLYKIEKQEKDVFIQQQRRTNLLIYGLIAICFGLVVSGMFIYSSRKRKVKRRLVEELKEML